MKTEWQDEEDIEEQVGVSAFSTITNSIRDTQSAITVLSITVTAEIGLLAMMYVSKEEVYKFLESGDTVWIYASMGIFLIGFLTAFAVFRMLPRSFPKPFFGYTIWLFSTATGLANIALFYVLLSFRIR